MAEAAPEKSDELARYEFKRALEELREIRGTATQLISLYIPPGTQIHDVMAQLRSEYGQASNIKSKSTMKNVTGALESAMQAIKNFKEPGEHGLAVFVGHKAVGGNNTRMVKHVLVPPIPLAVRKYHCDSTFFLEPLEAMLKEHSNYGLLVVDRQECTIGWLKGQAIVVVTNMQSQVPNKHAKGGQSARRFERITENIAEEWFKKCGEVATEIFKPAQEKGDLKGIIVGGPGPTKEYWLEGAFMDHELMKRIVGAPVDTGYTDEYGLRDLVVNAGPILKEFGLTQERDLVQRFSRELGKPDGGLAAYGEQQVRDALTIGAVDMLLLSEDIRKVRVTMKCAKCGATSEGTTNNPEHYENTHKPCDKCGDTMLIDQEADVIQELCELAGSMKTKVKLISGSSDEGAMLKTAFGGIAAILRFRTG